MKEALPNPPRLPRPMPDPPRAGWWVSPGADPRVVRYHDGNDWTEFVCRLGLRGSGEIERSPLATKDTTSPTDDPEIDALPKPGRFPVAWSHDRPEAGWFWAPDTRDMRNLRYYDGQEWTPFVCKLGLKGPGPITRKPRPAEDR